jgi:hypothetical protein
VLSRQSLHDRHVCKPASAAALHLPQELQALIKYIEINKAADLDWFTIRPSNKEGTHWSGKCWYVHDLIKYEFDFQVGTTWTALIARAAAVAGACLLPAIGMCLCSSMSCDRLAVHVRLPLVVLPACAF